MTDEIEDDGYVTVYATPVRYDHRIDGECYCGKRATVLRTADGARWCNEHSPYTAYARIDAP